MADFYPVLSRAIAGLSENTPEARRAVYDRATAVLVTQLRGMNPPVSETDIARQRLALQEAITRIEREQALPGFDDAQDQSPAPAREPLREATPERQAAPRPAPEQNGVAEQDGAAEQDAFAGRDGMMAAGDAPQGRARAQRAQPAALPEDDGFEQDDHVGAQGAATAVAGAGRPRLDIARDRPRRRLPWRAAVVVGGVGLVIGAIAFTAYTVNQTPAPGGPAPAQTAEPVQPTPGGKISDRLNERPADANPAAQPGVSPQMPPAPQQAQPAPAQPGAPPPPQGGLAVAQRAVAYIEPADASQQPRAVQGRVIWRVESGAATQGRRIETVLRADVDIADLGLNLVFTIRRNEDAAFPASHIVGMRFTRSGDDGNGAVREAGVPQFKAEESERGAPLAGITSALGENLFVTALSRVEVELNRNLDVMRTRNWIDVPIRFASGRRAIIAFEKGVSGEQRMAEAMRAWQP